MGGLQGWNREGNQDNCCRYGLLAEGVCYEGDAPSHVMASTAATSIRDAACIKR